MILFVLNNNIFPSIQFRLSLNIFNLCYGTTSIIVFAKTRTQAIMYPDKLSREVTADSGIFDRLPGITFTKLIYSQEGGDREGKLNQS